MIHAFVVQNTATGKYIKRTIGRKFVEVNSPDTATLFPTTYEAHKFVKTYISEF